MLSSNRPYLIRAIYEWVADNNLTPYVLVDVTVENVHVPEHVIQDDRVVLNISMQAAHDLELGDEAIMFHGRFAGKSEHIYLPVHSVLAIYAAENGEGMAFPESSGTEDMIVEVDETKDVLVADEVDEVPLKPPKPSKPTLKVVK